MGVEASKVGRVDRCCCSGRMWRPRAPWAMPAVDYGRKTCACAGKSRIVATRTERHRSCLFFCNDTQHSGEEGDAADSSRSQLPVPLFCPSTTYLVHTSSHLHAQRGPPPQKDTDAH